MAGNTHITDIIQSLTERDNTQKAQADTNMNAFQFALSPLASFLPLVAGAFANNIQRNIRNSQAISDFDRRIDNYTVESTQFEDGGLNQMWPIQAEKGEIVRLPDGQLVDVKADKKHGQMKKNENTDYLPGDAYIFSNKTTLNKKKADKVVVDIGLPMYSEIDEDKNSDYEERKLSDFMSKDKMTIAEIVKRVHKKIPLTNKKFDIFAEQAREKNVAYRDQVLQPLMVVNEAKKEGVKIFERGGYADKRPLGGLVGLAGLSKLLMDLGQEPAQQIPSLPLSSLSVRKGLQKSIQQIPQVPFTIKPGSNPLDEEGKLSFDPLNLGQRLYDLKESNLPADLPQGDNLRQQVNRNLLGQSANTIFGGLMGLAAMAGQDNRIDIPDFSGEKSYLEKIPDRVSQGTRDAVINQNQGQVNSIIKSAMSSGIPFNRLQPYLANVSAQGIKASNDAAVNFDLRDIELSSAKNRLMADFQSRQAQAEANRNNQQRAGSNNQLMGIAGIGSNMLGQLNVASAQGLSYNLAIDQLEREAQQQQINNQFTQLLMSRLAKQIK